MIFDPRRGHRLRIRNIRVISVDEDTSLGNIQREEVAGPERPVGMSPCLEGVVIPTTGVEAVDEDEAEYSQDVLINNLGIGGNTRVLDSRAE